MHQPYVLTFLSVPAFNVLKYVAISLLAIPLLELGLSSVITTMAQKHKQDGNDVAWVHTKLGVLTMHSKYYNTKSRLLVYASGFVLLATSLLLEFSFDAQDVYVHADYLIPDCATFAEPDTIFADNVENALSLTKFNSYFISRRDVLRDEAIGHLPWQHQYYPARKCLRRPEEAVHLTSYNARVELAKKFNTEMQVVDIVLKEPKDAQIFISLSAPRHLCVRDLPDSEQWHNFTLHQSFVYGGDVLVTHDQSTVCIIEESDLREDEFHMFCADTSLLARTNLFVTKVTTFDRERAHITIGPRWLIATVDVSFDLPRMLFTVSYATYDFKARGYYTSIAGDNPLLLRASDQLFEIMTAAVAGVCIQGTRGDTPSRVLQGQVVRPTVKSLAIVPISILSGGVLLIVLYRLFLFYKLRRKQHTPQTCGP